MEETAGFDVVASQVQRERQALVERASSRDGRPTHRPGPGAARAEAMPPVEVTPIDERALEDLHAQVRRGKWWDRLRAAFIFAVGLIVLWEMLFRAFGRRGM